MIWENSGVAIFGASSLSQRQLSAIGRTVRLIPIKRSLQSLASLCRERFSHELFCGSVALTRHRAFWFGLKLFEANMLFCS